MSDAKTFYARMPQAMESVQTAAPTTAKAFMGLFGAIMKDGALAVKHKELIAMAIGLAVRCEPCIYAHIKKCLDAGASRDEILEAASVVVMMQGGPSFMHLAQVADALDALGK